MKAVLPLSDTEPEIGEPTPKNALRGIQQVVKVCVYRLYNDVKMPFYSTLNANCFDISCYLGSGVEKVLSYNHLLLKSHKRVVVTSRERKRGVYIEPGEVLYIPTGLIFDIPFGYAIKLFSRSGSSSQKHLHLVNSVGTIDSDFVNEVIGLVINSSGVRQVITDGMRLMQGEVVPVIRAEFSELTVAPSSKTNRDGGFGHTGE